MKAIVLASIAVAFVVQLACGGGSDKPGGSVGGEGGGAAGSSGSGGAGGVGGSATTMSDASSRDSPDTMPAAADSAPAGDSGGTSDGGAPADSWESFAQGFFASYCVSCHNDDKKGDATRDYHLMANVLREKVEIACGVSKSAADWSKRGCSGFPPSRQFPVGTGPKPTDADRDRLLRWIDSGTP
jgi:hypothetical protein